MPEYLLRTKTVIIPMKTKIRRTSIRVNPELDVACLETIQYPYQMGLKMKIANIVHLVGKLQSTLRVFKAHDY